MNSNNINIITNGRRAIFILKLQPIQLARSVESLQRDHPILAPPGPQRAHLASLNQHGLSGLVRPYQGDFLCEEEQPKMGVSTVLRGTLKLEGGVLCLQVRGVSLLGEDTH